MLGGSVDRECSRLIGRKLGKYSLNGLTDRFIRIGGIAVRFDRLSEECLLKGVGHTSLHAFKVAVRDPLLDSLFKFSWKLDRHR